MFDFAEAHTIHDIVITQSSVFIVVISKDNRYYQIKIPSFISNPVTSEYLAYKIGKNLNLPLPNSAFIKIEFDFFKEIISEILSYDLEIHIRDKIESFNNSILIDNNNMTIFALEWVYNHKDIEDEEDLYDIVNEIICNEDEFYSVYSFDMLLCNFDRHCQNFIVDNNRSNILFIDHEKSFGSENFSLININKQYKECIYYDPKVSYLYDFITNDKQYNNIIRFSKDLDKIESKYIDDIFCDFEKLSSEKYEFSDEDIKNEIKSFFKSRIGNITTYIDNNKGECFDSIVS